MATTHVPSRGAQRRILLVVAPVAGVLIAGVGLSSPDRPLYGTEGTVARVKPSGRPTIQAAFPRESYRPRGSARLVLFERAPAASVQLFRAGTEHRRLKPRDLMLGTAVTEPQRVPAGSRSVRLRLGDWPSGLYYARLRAGARIGYAPFVLRPVRLGEHRVAIVLPTLTWQAYNFRNDDGRRRGQLVRAGVDRTARASVRESRRTAPLQVLRPAVPALAAGDPPRGRLPRPGGCRSGDGCLTRTRVRPGRLPRPPTST